MDTLVYNGNSSSSCSRSSDSGVVVIVNVVVLLVDKFAWNPIRMNTVFIWL